MRVGARDIALLFVCFLVVLAGCGGGGTLPAGASASSISGATQPPGASPVPYPSTDGAELGYAGTLTQTFVSYPEIVAPGSPSPEPTSVTTTNVSQEITIRTDQSFNGGSGLTDLHNVETDAQSSGLETTSSTTDTYEAIAQAGSSSQLLQYGSQYADEAGDTISTSYVPQRVEDQFPEVAGAQWTNGAGAQIVEALGGNSSGSALTVSRTVNTSGTYSQSTTYPPGYSADGYTGIGEIQENSDGSGTYAFVANGSAITIEYSAPVPQATGSPQITVAEFAGLDPTPADEPSESFMLNDWYGTAPSFYSEADIDLGAVAVPSSCPLGTAYPSTATALKTAIARTDTVIGYTESEVQTTYVASGYGVLCSVLSDTQTLYYDFNGDQADAFTGEPPLETITVQEVLGLQSGESTILAKTKESKVSGAVVSVAPALRAHFDRVVASARRRLLGVRR